jgi:glycine oxidase
MATDAIIIGGGIIGCAIAYRLAQEKLSVVVVERGQPGCEASSAGAGILAPHAEADRPDAFFNLCVKSRALYGPLTDQLRTETGIDVEYRPSGLLYAAFTEEDESELRERYHWQKEHKLPVGKLTASEAQAYEPHLSTKVREALYFAEDGQVDNTRLTAALTIAAAKRGVHFINGYPVLRVIVHNGTAVGVELPHERLIARWIINAAGSWSGLIDTKLAYAVPVHPVRGQIVAIHVPSTRYGRPIFRHVVYSPRGYMVPRVNDRILIGSTMENAGYDKSVTVEGMERLLRLALEISPDIAGGVFREAWAGLRPCTEDGLPVLGSGEIQGLIFATGHCRNGILLAPITAQLISEIILYGKPSMPIDAFAPERFRKR